MLQTTTTNKQNAIINTKYGSKMDIIEFKFNEKIAYLLNGGLSLKKYSSAIINGEIPDRSLYIDDYEFQENFPSHPLAISNKAKRMEAADWIRNVVLSNPTLFKSHRLKFLHQALFDCCAAVREAMIVTLAYLSNKESIGYFKSLQELEPPENTIHQYLSKAIDVVEGRCAFKETYPLNIWLRIARIDI